MRAMALMELLLSGGFVRRKQTCFFRLSRSSCSFCFSFSADAFASFRACSERSLYSKPRTLSNFKKFCSALFYCFRICGGPQA